MSIYVNTNVSSINTTNKLTKATNSLDTTYKRLSSGLRINSAKDDAAGLQISNRLTSQINGLKQGNRNANDGIALAQTAEGALDEVHTMLQRIRTLSVQSANGTNTTADRKSIQAEVSQLCSEINRIACKTTFGGHELLSGKDTKGNTLVNKANAGNNKKEGYVDFQVGSNANDTISINLGNGFSVAQMAKGANDTEASDKFVADSDTAAKVKTGGKAFSVSTADNAQITLKNIDKYIAYVDKTRGELGAVQNRLESTISNQSNIAENESDARSRIRDTDYAEEAANLSQQNIIQQAASSMLTQANARPQIALSLLG